MSPTKNTLGLGPRERVLALVAAVALAFAIFLTPPADAAQKSVHVLDHHVKPLTRADNDRSGVELGMRFSSSRAGKIAAIQFYRSRAQKRSFVGTVWSAAGTRLATTRFRASNVVGWQTAKLKKPVRVRSGQTLVISYYAPAGRYVATQGAFRRGARRHGFTVPANGGVYRYGAQGRFPTQSWRGSNYFVDVVFKPTVTASAKPTTSAAPSSPAAPPKPSGFPSARTTGVPAGTTLRTYRGPCTITTANTVIDAKLVNCSLTIRAKGVVVRRSRINGSIANDTVTSSFIIRDSEVNVGDNAGTGIGNRNFTAQRVHVTGGNRSVNCDSNCTVEDSYVHGQFRDSTGVSHESGIRMGENTVVRHNTIACDAPDVPPDAGCSADLTGYGDFSIVENNLVTNNLFKASTGGFCAYGGSSAGKPYSNGVHDVRFVDNVFERGRGGKCGYWGPITSFDSSARGNRWSGNTWTDGTTVPPSN